MTLERFSRPRAFIRIGSGRFQLELATECRSGSRPRRVSMQGQGYRATGQPRVGNQRPRGRGLSLVPQSFFRILSGHRRGESPTRVAGCSGNEKAHVVDHRRRRWLAIANKWSLEANNGVTAAGCSRSGNSQDLVLRRRLLVAADRRSFGISSEKGIVGMAESKGSELGG